LEINLQLPGQFIKTVRIGNPENADGLTEVQKQFDVIVMRTGEENVSSIPLSDGKKVVIVKNGDGTVLAEDIKPADERRKIIIKKDDGAVRELNPGEDGGTIIFERKAAGGGNAQFFNTEDGAKIVVHQGIKTENISGNRHNEMFRTTLALLLTAPEGLDVSYTFAGEGNVDGNACNIVQAQTGGDSFKLFLDKSTYLPRMISYEGREFPRVLRFKKDDSGNLSKERVFELKTAASDAKTIEQQLKFSDYRSVGGLLLPHRWTESLGDGKQSQNIEITNYEINPANIADKFKGQKVFVRKAEEQ
jgi:hypothetical protein